MPLVVGIDPASGVSSPVGVAIFDPDSKEILAIEDVWPAKGARTLHQRLCSIYDQVSDILAAIPPDERVYAYLENFVMRGRGGEQLARASGALIAAVPSHWEFDEVHNITLKALVGGSGKADKLGVADGVARYFEDCTASHDRVLKIIKNKEFDKTDALAVGIAGWMRETHNG